MHRDPKVSEVREGRYTVRGPKVEIEPGGTVITDIDSQETVIYPVEITVLIEGTRGDQAFSERKSIDELVEEYVRFKRFFEQQGGHNRVQERSET